jgi:hypothetical protein
MIDRMKHSGGEWWCVKLISRNTIGKDEVGAYPSERWMKSILLAEHSPIRIIRFTWRWKDLPYWVSTHFVRHKIGIEHWVSTQRTDRTGIERDQLPQNAPVNHMCEADAQALINISRKRLCRQAAQETREAWMQVRDEVQKIDPVLASVMVPECVYRGFCPEMNPCGYAETEAYRKALEAYRKL